MVDVSGVPLLLALGYGVVLGRVFRRLTIVEYDGDGKPPEEDLLKESYGGFAVSGLLVGMYYIYKYAWLGLDQYGGPILAALFEGVPPVVGVVLAVVGVIDHLLEKEGFVG